MPDEDLLIVATKRNGERYIWLYSPSHASDVLRSADRFASNPELNFTWWDAALISQSVRRAMEDESLAVDTDEPGRGTTGDGARGSGRKRGA